MSEIQVWSKYKQDQLVLNLCELSKYFAFAQGGIQTTFLRRDGQLPTLLHSAGNALYTTPVVVVAEQLCLMPDSKLENLSGLLFR